MKPNTLRFKIHEKLHAHRFRIILHEQIIDLSRQDLYRKLANPLYDRSLEDTIYWELRKQILNEVN
jgi:hypothetical protein